ncbi:hypothetical protein [Haloarcula pellucida]|uniref:Uncharacterized protein n=1 Tax=Haloarcula pellucida TaxID=1427151 RepID=A0A830GJG7_9EURY|nr:hypothetical protein [Halomicroarcula pellucida]MBX0348694.1 hypothetical protein [Halomicroarcula pellucida]GGN92182.1 hypothetical protein GCM10009030_16150 [Halomicroarcula pellucida]
MTLTLETPCNTKGKWLTCPTDSRRADDREYCGQCFPDGEDSVAEFGVETYLLTFKNGTRLHRSVDTGEEADTSGFGDHDYPDERLADKLASDDVTLDHEFEWDRQRSGGDA